VKVVDRATYYRAMQAFCLQRSKMEDECRAFWEAEAVYWSQRLTVTRMVPPPLPDFPDSSWWC
jgi:hypothetical protein